MVLSLDAIRARLGQDELRIFLAVASLRSFSAAAETLHKSTSAVSYRIKMLEESLDVDLFVRTTRTVTLTPAGEFLFDKVSEIFDWLRDLPEQIHACAKGEESVFTLVINNLLYNPEGAATLLAHLLHRFPQTQFSLKRAVFMGVWDEMLNNPVHLAVGAPGTEAMNEKYQAMPLGMVNWSFVVAPGHPLAERPHELSDDELRHFPAINVEDTSSHTAKRIAWKLARQKELIVPDMSTKIAAHRAGLGIGFLPAHMAQALAEQKLLVECRVQNHRRPSPLALVWRTHDAGKVLNHTLDLFRNRDPVIQSFLLPIDPAPQKDAG